MLIILVIALMIPLAAVILDSQLGRALAARVESRGIRPGSSEHRISVLEGEVERLSQELRRLEEEAEFVQHLLLDRGGDHRGDQGE